MNYYFSILKQISLDNVQHNFICALQNLVHSQVSKESLNWIVLEIPVASVHLQGVIHYVKAFVSGKLFGHRTIHGVVWIFVGDAGGSVTDHEPACLQICGHFSELELNILISREWLSELLSGLYIICSKIKAFRSSSKRATCNV